MTTKLQWRQSARRKYPTVADVEHALARCHCRLEAAPTPARKRNWQGKIEFLNRLRTRLCHRNHHD